MIVAKTWERYARDKRGHGSTDFGRKNYHDTYHGWFLFGFIPLFIRRSRERR